MEIQELDEYYKSKLEIRDIMPSLIEELNELSEQDIIKKYLQLLKLVEENIDVYDKTDDEVLDEILSKQKVSINLPNYYVCLGQNLNGAVKDNGEYYLLPKEFQKSRLRPPIKVAILRNFEDPNDTIIIPMKNMEKFKEENIVTAIGDNKTEEEYYEYRKRVFKNELSSYKERELVKKH